MTEKRFYIKCDEYHAWSVWEKDKDVVVFDLLKSDAEVVCKALNEFNDKNEQLKKEKKKLKEELWEAQTEYIHERYFDNPIREKESINELKEDFKSEYWND